MTRSDRRHPRPLVIAAPDPARKDELYDLVAKVFSSHEGYYGFRDACRQGYYEGSTYDWAVSRVGHIDGRLVCHVGVWEYSMCVGSRRLRTGGIGAVATDADFRRQGHAGTLMRAVMAAMADAGYDFSVLFGRRNYYDRFGYVKAWPYVRHILDTADLPAGKLEGSLRPVPLEEVFAGSLAALHNREHAAATGALVRPIFRRVTDSTRKAVSCHALVRAGRTAAYVAAREEDGLLNVMEVGGFAAPGGVETVLAAVRALAGRRHCRRVRFTNFSPAHPVMRRLRALTCRVEADHVRNGGPMAAVLSLPSCLRKLEPLLSDRLAGSAMRGFSGRLGVAGDGASCALRVGGGAVAVEEPPGRTPRDRLVAGPAVAQLILGTESPGVLAEQSGVRFFGAAGDLAEALFPAQAPALEHLDHF